MRLTIIDMILATEMTKHFEHLSKFKNVSSHRVGDTISEVNSLNLQILIMKTNSNNYYFYKKKLFRIYLIASNQIY